MPRQNIKHLLPVFPPAAGGNLDPQHDFLALVVDAIIVNKLTAAIGLRDGPSGKATGYSNDVLLRVPAVNTQSVQLHQLARVVFVQAARLLCLLFGKPPLRKTVGRNALPVIEIEQHGRAFRRGFQQIAELAEYVRTNRIALIRSSQDPVGALIHVYVEVVEPEVGHLLFELAIAVNRAIELGFVQIIREHLLRRSVGYQVAALYWIECAQDLLTHRLLRRIAAFAL